MINKINYVHIQAAFMKQQELMNGHAMRKSNCHNIISFNSSRPLTEYLAQAKQNKPCTMHMHDFLGGYGSMFNHSVVQVASQPLNMQ